MSASLKACTISIFSIVMHCLKSSPKKLCFIKNSISFCFQSAERECRRLSFIKLDMDGWGSAFILWDDSFDHSILEAEPSRLVLRIRKVIARGLQFTVNRKANPIPFCVYVRYWGFMSKIETLRPVLNLGLNGTITHISTYGGHLGTIWGVPKWGLCVQLCREMGRWNCLHQKHNYPPMDPK